MGFPHLSKAIPNVAMYLADAPAEVLTIFKEVRRLLPHDVFSDPPQHAPPHTPHTGLRP